MSGGVFRIARRGAGLWMALTVSPFSISCIEAGTEPIEIPLRVAGTEANEPLPARNGWSVTLEQADIAFGPLTLCPGVQAGELCETARAEWLDAVVVDALDEAPERAGSLLGTEGVVRSWMMDLGFVSLLTEPEPLTLDAAEQLDGHSLRLAGTAMLDDVELRFRLELAVRQEEQTERGVAVIRQSGDDEFVRALDESVRSLTVRFDPRTWIGTIDFDALRSGPECDPECPDVVVPAPDSQAIRAVRGAVLSGERPDFEWATR